MPTYEYVCSSCDHRFETWQKMTDEPLTACPECGSPIRRVFFPAGIVFKGHGFYKTDHGNGAAPAANGSENGQKKSESGTAETTAAASSASATSSSSSSEGGSSSSGSSESKASSVA